MVFDLYQTDKNFLRTGTYLTKIKDFEVEFEEKNTGDLELIQGSKITFTSNIKKKEFPGNKEEFQYSQKMLESDKSMFSHNEKFLNLQITQRTRSKSFGDKVKDTLKRNSSGLESNKPKTPRFFVVEDQKMSERLKDLEVSSQEKTRKKSVFGILGSIFNPEKNLSNTTIKVYKCFGEEVEKIFEKEKTLLPKALTFLINYLIENKLEEEKGIFRVSAQKSVIQTVQDLLDKGEKIDTEKYMDIHIFACVFKQYFRLLPTPLLTFDLYGEFLLVNMLPLQQRAEQLVKLLKLLSKPRRAIFYNLMKILRLVAANAKENMMGTGNLSIVFGVSILVSKNKFTDPIEMFQESQKAIGAFSNFFKLWDDIQEAFEDVKDVKDVVN